MKQKIIIATIILTIIGLSLGIWMYLGNKKRHPTASSMIARTDSLFQVLRPPYTFHGATPDSLARLNLPLLQDSTTLALFQQKPTYETALVGRFVINDSIEAFLYRLHLGQFHILRLSTVSKQTGRAKAHTAFWALDSTSIQRGRYSDATTVLDSTYKITIERMEYFSDKDSLNGILQAGYYREILQIQADGFIKSLSRENITENPDEHSE